MNIRFTLLRALACCTVSTFFAYSVITVKDTFASPEHALSDLKRATSKQNVPPLNSHYTDHFVGRLRQATEPMQAHIRRTVNIRLAQLGQLNLLGLVDILDLPGLVDITEIFLDDFFGIFEKNSPEDFLQQMNLYLPPGVDVNMAGDGCNVDAGRTVVNMYIIGCLLVRLIDQQMAMSGKGPFVIKKVGKTSLVPTGVVPETKAALRELARAKKDFAIFVNCFLRCKSVTNAMINLIFNICDGTWPPQIEADKFDSDEMCVSKEACDPNTVPGIVLIFCKIGSILLRKIRALEEHVKNSR
jgi:hypothetical protein